MDVLADGHRQHGADEQGEIGQNDFLARIEVAQRDDEQQSQRIAHLRDHGDEVGAKLRDAQFLPYQVEQGLVVVDVGYRHTCHDGKGPEDMGGEAAVFFQFLFHADVVTAYKKKIPISFRL